MKILQYSHPILTTPTNEITNWTREIHGTAREMSRLLGTIEDGVAIAANQVGSTDSFFIHRVDGTGIHHTVINPKLIFGEKIVYEAEGCLSFRDTYAVIPRFARISVQYVSFPSMELIQEDIEDEFRARVFQHEMEHLSGKVMIDNIEDEAAKNEFLERYRKASRNHRPAKSARR